MQTSAVLPSARSLADLSRLLAEHSPAQTCCCSAPECSTQTTLKLSAELGQALYAQVRLVHALLAEKDAEISNLQLELEAKSGTKSAVDDNLRPFSLKRTSGNGLGIGVGGISISSNVAGNSPILATPAAVPSTSRPSAINIRRSRSGASTTPVSPDWNRTQSFFPHSQLPSPILDSQPTRRASYRASVSSVASSNLPSPLVPASNLVSHGTQTDYPDHQLNSVPRFPFTQFRSVSVASDNSAISSSTADTRTSILPVLLDHMSKLAHRIAQADVNVLNRKLLKHKLSGDATHLAHSTMQGLLTDLNSLRDHFRSIADKEARSMLNSAFIPNSDREHVSLLTRKDLTSLVKLLQMVFMEYANLRRLLNDITITPAMASQLKQSGDGNDDMPSSLLRTAGGSSGVAAAAEWIAAPLSKLFGPVVPALEPQMTGVGTTSSSYFSAAKIVPKLAASSAATQASVNVEFSGGRVATHIDHVSESTLKNSFADRSPDSQRSRLELPANRRPIPGRSKTSRSELLSIFAGGASSSLALGGKPWNIISENSVSSYPHSPASTHASELSFASQRRLPASNNLRISGKENRNSNNRLSTIVDAVIDSTSEEQSGSTLLERTTRGRPRGLSDSSIRSVALDEIPITKKITAPNALQRQNHSTTTPIVHSLRPQKSFFNNVLGSFYSNTGNVS